MTADPHAVSRRFLQARRRGPLDASEVTRLLAHDAEYVEVVGDQELVVTGAEAIAELLRRMWAGIAGTSRMQIIRHAVVDESTAMGHWRREDEGGVVTGRDIYTLRDGRITRILVEEFGDLAVPGAVLKRA